MKYSIWFLSLTAMANCSFAQDSTSIGHFNKIIISPRVNVILKKGDNESVYILYNGIPVDKVNVKAKGNILRIFLDHARVTEKQVRVNDTGNTRKQGIYHGSSITAYVTYKDLKSIDMRGEEELECSDDLTADKFKLKAYGETEIRLASLHAKKFKASLYGENYVNIKSGETYRQVYSLFGENKIDTRDLQSEVASARLYGEGRVYVNASNEIHINAFGEPTVMVTGTSVINKGIILGRADIHSMR